MIHALFRESVWPITGHNDRRLQPTQVSLGDLNGKRFNLACPYRLYPISGSSKREPSNSVEQASHCNTLHKSHFQSRTIHIFCGAHTLLLSKFCFCQLSKTVFAGDKGESSAVVPFHMDLANIIDHLNSSSRSRWNGCPRILHADEHYPCPSWVALFVSLSLPTQPLPFVHHYFLLLPVS